MIISFAEASGSDTIGFLLPNPLREHANEFETGSQMTARQLAWARGIAGNTAVALDSFDICTTLWSHCDPALVLGNYTYRAILSLPVEVRPPARIKSATSVERGAVHREKTETGARVIPPLDGTDIVVLEHE